MKKTLLILFTVTMTVLGAAQSPSMKGSFISRNGVGPVKVGQNYTIEDVLNRCKLPDTYPGLYDEIQCDRNDFSGEFEIICRQNGGISLLVFSDEDDHVSCFTVVTDRVKTESGLSTASTAADILAAGAKVEKMPMMTNDKVTGYRYRLSLGGLYFLFRNSDVSAGRIKADARPYGISNTLFGGVSEDELAIM